jgi:hypothetical protein
VRSSALQQRAYQVARDARSRDDVRAFYKSFAQFMRLSSSGKLNAPLWLPSTPRSSPVSQLVPRSARCCLFDAAGCAAAAARILLAYFEALLSMHRPFTRHTILEFWYVIPLASSACPRFTRAIVHGQGANARLEFHAIEKTIETYNAEI